MDTPFSPLPDLFVLPSSLPVPGGSFLPVHAFVLRGPETILVDAGLAAEAAAVIDALDTVVDPADLRWIVVTHEDADHTGALAAILDRAPRAEVVVTETGVGKLSSTEAFAPDRYRVVRPGTELDLGRHRFRVLAPPMYDSPATLMLMEVDRGWLFSSDAYGAFVPGLPERAEELPLDAVLDGMATFCGLNSPWLADVDADAFAARVSAIEALDPEWVFAAHLAPLRSSLFSALTERARLLPGHTAAMRQQAA